MQPCKHSTTPHLPDPLPVVVGQSPVRSSHALPHPTHSSTARAVGGLLETGSIGAKRVRNGLHGGIVQAFSCEATRGSLQVRGVAHALLLHVARAHRARRAATDSARQAARTPPHPYVPHLVRAVAQSQPVHQLLVLLPRRLVELLAELTSSAVLLQDSLVRAGGRGKQA